MRHRITALLLSLAICLHVLVPTISATCVATQTATQQEITEAILTLQEEYPDGTTWTNQSPSPGYRWVFPGSLWNMGGCAAFAAIIQDETFGSYTDIKPTLQMVNGTSQPGGITVSNAPYSWETLWPGDIIRFNGHSVIVVEKQEDYITIAEGNSGGRIRWGRTLNKEAVNNNAQYVITRYTKMEPLMPYTDLPKRGHWSYNAIVWALLDDIAAPISATCFGPKQECTRADVISYLWAASGRPEPELTELPFEDVPASASYRTAVLWALEQGITSGTSATTFSPDMICTRTHVLTFLWRAAGSPETADPSVVFEDVPSCKYYFASVAWAQEQRITSGTSATTFSPDRNVTRAEALTFICLALDP